MFETLDRKNRLTITGLKEGVVWIKDDQNDKPIGWMAGIGIAGLIPDPFKGYKFRYVFSFYGFSRNRFMSHRLTLYKCGPVCK